MSNASPWVATRVTNSLGERITCFTYMHMLKVRLRPVTNGGWLLRIGDEFFSLAMRVSEEEAKAWALATIKMEGL